MSTLTYTVPTPGVDLNSTADAEISSALNAILSFANGSIDLANLSTTLQGYIAGGGWSNLTLPSNVAAGTVTPACRLECGGTVVRFKGSLTNNTGVTISSGNQIATLAAGFRPANNINAMGGVQIGGTVGALNVLSSGVVNLVAAAGLPNAATLWLDGATFTLS